MALHQSRDVLHKRCVIAYAVVLMLVGDLLLRLAGNGPSALVSLLNVVLLLVPLIALILGSASLYGAREFTELLLVQPIPHRALNIGLYFGLTVPLMGATLGALLLPFIVERQLDAMASNPIDLVRTIRLLRLDVAAFMGYTGAVFRAAFGTTSGLVIAFAVLATWIVAPWWLGARAFERRDF